MVPYIFKIPPLRVVYLEKRSVRYFVPLLEKTLGKQSPLHCAADG